MSSIKPVYLILLFLVLILFVYIKINNPHREYSTAAYWENASIESVQEIPDEAIGPGNKNGPVLMWAAIGADDPEILRALVSKGSEVNESDGIFKGTPLTGASGYTDNTEMIDVLIELGADVNKQVHNGETALIIAARYNHNPGIITALLKHGADPEHKSNTGLTAEDYAKQENNKIALKELQQGY